MNRRISKYIVVVMALLVLAGCSGVPSLKKVFTLSEEKTNRKLFNVRQDTIRKTWGEPDSIFSGFYGDIYRNPENSNNLIDIYYDPDTKTVTNVVFFDRQINTYSISYELGDAADCFTVTPLKAVAGETVEVRTGILFDADIHVSVDGQEIEKTHYDSDYWGYSFIMPEKDVVVTAWFYAKGEDWRTDSDDLTVLKEKYPEYFGLSTIKGLEVYVWQMAPESYSFGLLEGTNIEKTFEQLWNMKGISASQMRAILSSYDIDKNDIIIIPYQNPISSYLCDYFIVQVDESEESIQSRRQAYIDKIRDMLFTQQ